MTNINKLIKHFNLVMDLENSCSDVKYIRSTICNKKDAFKFINHFSYSTDTSWKLLKRRVPQGRCVYFEECASLNPLSPNILQKGYQVVSATTGDTNIFQFNAQYHIADKGNCTVKIYCIFYNVWGCQNIKCMARIWIFVLGSHHSDAQNDPFLLQNPSLPCIIKMSLEHQHNAEIKRKELKLIPDDVKKTCFKYFDAGLNSVDTRQKLLQKACKKKIKCIPSTGVIRQIYLIWLARLKCRYDLKDDATTSMQNTFLDIIPKKNYFRNIQNTQQSQLKKLRISEDNVYSLLFQLKKPSTSAKNDHLLYSLSIGKNQSLVSSKSVPHIISVVINLPYDAITKKHNSSSISNSKDYEPSSNFQNNEVLPAASEGNNPIMPVIFKIFNEDAATEEHSLSENICTITLNDLLLPGCSITRNFEFPLVFTVINSSSEMLYELKQGVDQKVMNILTKPMIFSVEIKPPSYASVNGTDFENSTQINSSKLSYEDDIHIYIKKEVLSDGESCIESNSSQLPVICNIASCPSARFSENNGVISSITSDLPLSDIFANTVVIKKEITDTDFHEKLNTTDTVQEMVIQNRNCLSSSQKISSRRKKRKRNHTGSTILTRKQTSAIRNTKSNLPFADVSTNIVVSKKRITDADEKLNTTIINTTDSNKDVVYQNKGYLYSSQKLSSRKKEQILNYTGSTIQTRSKLKLVKTLIHKNKCCDIKKDAISGSNETSSTEECSITSQVLDMPINSQVSHLHDQITQTDNDDDFVFLVSLLPEFRKVSKNKKTALKSSIKNLVMNCNDIYVTRRLFPNGKNIYRECGVLPTFRDMKF